MDTSKIINIKGKLATFIIDSLNLKNYLQDHFV